MRSSVILITILLLAACSPARHPTSLAEITGVVTSSTPVNTQQPSPSPTQEPPTPTPEMAIVEFKGDFEGYSAYLDENSSVKFITDSDGKTILPDQSTGVFRVKEKNNLYFYDKKIKKWPNP